VARQCSLCSRLSVVSSGGLQFFGSSTYPGVVAAEVCAGIAVGLIVGIFRPHLKSAISASLVGLPAGLAFALVARVELYGFEHWGGSDFFAVVVYACLIGPPTALLLWYRFGDRG
jgi:hypothetical protein